MSERWELLREIGRLRVEYWRLRIQEWRALLSKDKKVKDIIPIHEQRLATGAKLAELRKKYDESGKGGAR